MPGIPDADAEPADAPVKMTVGMLLRTERERRNFSLDDIAQYLRIRRVLLEAIEQGRFNALPGTPYAVGFVRAYAEFLGLDREELVSQFKAEAAGLEDRKELHFPRPLSESRLPGGVILLLSIIVAAGAYGAWYFQSSADRTPLPRVAAVPERLVPLVDHPVRPAEPPREALAAIASVAPERVTPAPATTAAPAEPAKPVAAEPPPPAPVQAVAVSAPAERPALVAPVPAAPAPAEPTAAPRLAALPTSPEPPAPIAAPVEPAAPVASVAPSEPLVIPAPPSTAPSPPRVFGDQTGGARISIRATADSWVQVREGTANIVFMRVMRAGDSYNVPNRPGLFLYTGSAGALEIRVDGKDTPAIGRVGMVRREVALDPDRLVAGTAVPAPVRPAATEPAPTTEPARPAPSGG